MKGNNRVSNTKKTSTKGMTLVEVLVAMALLMLIIFTFLPLFMSYYKNIWTAGEITKTTYEKASLIERLLANKTKNSDGYETSVSAVPLILSCDGTSLDFSTDNYGNVQGAVISNNQGAMQSYATMYTARNSEKMVCFPTALTDDFVSADITVVAKGFEFLGTAEEKKSNGSGYHFVVYNTDSAGNQVKVSEDYYDINYVKDGDSWVAVFTFYGGNDVICFQNSPLVIKYGAGSDYSGYKSVDVEIGAPEIILVGEEASDGNYYYYATSGVNTRNSHLDIIAKKMTGDAGTNTLTAAMNDVEWVAKGKGDDGNGNVNQYGYYVMGGDAGQIHRFWRNATTGNYYWDGDKVVQYTRYNNVSGGKGAQATDAGGSWEGSYADAAGTVFLSGVLKSVLTTEAKFSSHFNNINNTMTNIYSSPTVGQYIDSSNLATDASSFLYFNKGAIGDDYRFALNAASYGTISNDSKWGTSTNKVLTVNNGSSDNENSWQTADVTATANMNVNGYKAATGYEYNNTITITSVGAVKINNSAYMDTATSPFVANETNLYPTESYTLYCGYIPATANIIGSKFSSTNLTSWIYQGTLGVAKVNNQWYPTALFGDTKTSSNLKTSLINGTSYATLLGWESDNAALASNKNDYYITSGDEVDITMGYLSQPYATVIINPKSATNFVAEQKTLFLGSITGSDIFFFDDQNKSQANFTIDYLKYYNNAAGNNFNDNGGGKFDHNFPGNGLRDYVTLLDVKSWHDDVNDKDFSIAVGYSVGVHGSDISGWTRLAQVYNTGIVYIRATGDGTTETNDGIGDINSGKGWSLGNETNVFHEFYSTYSYQNVEGRTAVYTALGWDTRYHKYYHNLTNANNKAPTAKRSPTQEYMKAGFEVGKQTHPMEFCECTTVNYGTTWDSKPQLMWGTSNGTLLSWFYDYENKDNSKITSVAKEFESYQWSYDFNDTSNGIMKNVKVAFWDTQYNLNKLLENSYLGYHGSDTKLTDLQQEFYDYTSVKNGNWQQYGFISTLDKINDVAYGDDYWVAVGDQSGENPADYCANSGNSCPRGTGSCSYINVKTCIDEENNLYAWKAVKIDGSAKVNIISITYCEGIWYATGYIDDNDNSEQDNGEKCVIYYSLNPDDEWILCKTRDKDGNYSNTSTKAVIFDNGSTKDITLTGINSMASQG